MAFDQFAEWGSQASAMNSIDELRRLREHVASTAMPPYTGNAYQWQDHVNGLYDTIIQKAVALSHRQMLDEGAGPCPVSYAFVLFGSGGRGEQTLSSDQDNGLIYEDTRDESVHRYMERFSEIIVGHLERLGFPPCDGNVVCTNSKWRKPLDQWSRMLDDWLQDAGWESVRYLLITADMRCLYGDAALVNRIRASYLNGIAQTPSITSAMVRNTLHHKITLGVFGQLIRERYGASAGGFDIKYGAYIPFVNGIRLLAVRAGIDEASTVKRIRALEAQAEGRIRPAWSGAFEKVLSLRLLAPFEKRNGMYFSRNHIPKETLTPGLQLEIKEVLRIGRELQRYVNRLGQ